MRKIIAFILVLVLAVFSFSCESVKPTTVFKNTSSEEVKSSALPDKTKESTEENTVIITAETNNEKTKEKTEEEKTSDRQIHPNVKMTLSKSSFKSDEAVEVSLKDEAKLGFFYSSADFSLWTVDERGEYKAVELSGYGVPASYFEVLADPGESSGYAYLKAFSGLESGKSYILRLDITDSFNACAEVEITIE